MLIRERVRGKNPGKTCFTLGLECLFHIYSHEDSFESSPSKKKRINQNMCGTQPNYNFFYMSIEQTNVPNCPCLDRITNSPCVEEFFRKVWGCRFTCFAFFCTLSCSWQWFSHSQFEVNCQCQDHKLLLSFAMAKACQKLFDNNIQSSWLVVAFSFQQFYPSHPLRSIFLKLLRFFDISNILHISQICRYQNEMCFLSQLCPETNTVRVLKGESRVHHIPVLHVYF